jgi:hypothetical protein
VFTRLDHAWGSARDTASTIGVCGRRWRLSGAGSSRRSSRYPGTGVGSTIREFSVIRDLGLQLTCGSPG